MQLSDFTVQEQSGGALQKLLRQWTPRVEKKVIDLFNKGYSETNVQKILVAEENFKLPTYSEGRIDFKGLKKIFAKLLESGKIKSIPKDKKLFNPVKDKQILDLFIDNRKTFEGNPTSRLLGAYNAKYGLTKGTNIKRGTGISVEVIKNAFNRAIAGQYPEYDELFKGRELSEFFKTRHENIFPQVKTLDTVIKKAIKDGYLIDETQFAQTRMERLKKEYAKAAGISNDAKLENNFLTRMRRILALYGGSNTERYEQKLYDQIKPPSGYMESKLQKNLIAIGQHAGRMSNKDMALALGLGKQKANFLNDLQWASTKIGKMYGLPKVVKKGTEMFMAGDHTDSKAVMENLPNYKKNFMRIAYISHGLNQFKAGYDSKINALRKQAELGYQFDKGIYTTGMPKIHTFMKGTDNRVDLRSQKFNPAIHERRQVGLRSQGYYSDPFSGPLTKAERVAGGRTIPAAIKKLQQEFTELTGGYKLGGFKIKKRGAIGAGNITIEKFLQPRIDIRKSPVSEAVLETIRNLKYSAPEDAAYRIQKANLNVVDRALLGREGLTTKGRINILKKFGPQDFKTSGYMQAMRIASRESPKVTAIMNKGINEAVRLANVNDGDICRIFGMKRGGLAGGGCGPQMRQALQEAPEETMTKIAEVGSSKLKNAARGFLGALGRFGPAAGKFGAIAAAGAVAKPAFDMVRQFVNDDPSTYLTDPEQMERMLLSTIEAQERKRPRSEILDWSLTGAGVGATAAAVPGTGALWKARRLPFKREATLLRKGIDKAAYGMPRAALGPAMKLVSGMFTPAGLLATEPLRIAQMRRQGEDWGEIAQDPTLWMGPAFAPSMTKLATAGMKSKPLLAKALRLGMSPGALKVLGRTGGIGLLASLGLTGYDKYKDWKNKRGWFAKD